MFPAFSTGDVNSPAITADQWHIFPGVCFYKWHVYHPPVTWLRRFSPLIYIDSVLTFFCVFHQWLRVFPPFHAPVTCFPAFFTCVLYSYTWPYFLILFTARLLFGLRDLFVLYLVAMDKVQCSFLTRCFLANFSAYFIKCCEFLNGKQNRVGF